MRRNLWLAWMTAVVLSTTLVGLPTAQAKAWDNSTLDVWSWNITGAGTNKDDPQDINNGGSLEVLNAIKNKIDAGGRPDVIALQEVCYLQSEDLKRYLVPRGYTVHWRATKQQDRCTYNHGTPGNYTHEGHGDLVAVPTGYWRESFSRDVDSNTPSPEPIDVRGEGLTCMTLEKLARWYVACSAHISGTKAERLKKTYRMHAEVVKPIIGVNAGVVIAGDFNSIPVDGPRAEDPMANLYSTTLGGDGLMWEADMKASCAAGVSRCRNGRWTHENRGNGERRKLDYVFFTDNFFWPGSVSLAIDDHAARSYHRFLKMTVGTK